MWGPLGAMVDSGSDHADRGIVPRVFQNLFSRIQRVRRFFTRPFSFGKLWVILFDLTLLLPCVDAREFSWEADELPMPLLVPRGVQLFGCFQLNRVLEMVSRAEIRNDIWFAFPTCCRYITSRSMICWNHLSVTCRYIIRQENYPEISVAIGLCRYHIQLHSFFR